MPHRRSSNPSLTKARVSASRQCLKMLPATEVSCGSSSAEPIAAATTGHPAVKSLSARSCSQNSTNSLTRCMPPRWAASSMTPAMASPAYCRASIEDLIPAPGEVVVHRTARSAAAGEHLVDRHTRGTALAHHLGGADQHVAFASNPAWFASWLPSRRVLVAELGIGRQATLRCAKRSSDRRRSGTRCVNWRPAKLSSMTHIVCLL